MNKFKNLKKGDYVRLRGILGGINEIEVINDDRTIFYLYKEYYDCNSGICDFISDYQLEDKIEKFSSDIKDILKPGDLINGDLICKHPDYEELVVLTRDEKFNTIIVPLKKYDIKGKRIVTLEQFIDWGYYIL